MGCAFSSSGRGRPGGALPPFSGVRVIHSNGYVEDFPAPGPGAGVVTVSHVTGAKDPSVPPRHVLCSAAHLLQPGRGPFRPDDALQPGTVYFLLPHSAFHAEASAVDLACLMNRLTALARRGRCAAAAPPVEAAGDARRQQQQDAMMASVAGQRATTTKVVSSSSPARPAPWRPRLDRIDESMGRSSIRSSASSHSSACSEA